MVSSTDVEGKKRCRSIITLTEKGIQVCDQMSQRIEELLDTQSNEISNLKS